MQSSRPTWGVWIEIFRVVIMRRFSASRPTWGVWIEIAVRPCRISAMNLSRPTWGVWIEIRSSSRRSRSVAGRAPPGACGLKSFLILLYIIRLTSRPTWGVWIEIMDYKVSTRVLTVAPHLGRVD